MSVAHQSLATIIGQLVGMAAEQGRYFGLDGLRQQRSRACAKPWSAGPQKFLAGRVGKLLVSVTAYHSLGGEVEASSTPTIRRLTLHAVTNFRS